jgi:uncharacterized Fe-S cluster protein YjdI/CDGSH-type Zn-finger protein
MTKRTYEDDSIRVLWDSSLCIHTGFCISAGSGAFDPQRRPWVDLDLAETDVIAQAVEACPTGALRYERLDGGAQEEPQSPTTIVPWPNGPLFVRGSIEVTDRRGDVFLAGPRVSLCRCGASRNQPFCDLSHRDSGFTDNPRARTRAREAAECPADIDETTLSGR